MRCVLNMLRRFYHCYSSPLLEIVITFRHEWRLRTDMDNSLETIEIMFLPDNSEPNAARSKPRNNRASPSTLGLQQEQHPETARTSRGIKTAERHVAFQDPLLQQQATIHPLFRHRPESGRAGNIGALDNQIARHGGTTSSFEELPHRLKISKKNQPMTASERLVELTRTNGFLLQELAYYKDTRAAEMRFLDKVTELRADMEGTLAVFDQALEERSKARADAESTLLNYWGIDLGDGNVEDNVF